MRKHRIGVLVSSPATLQESHWLAFFQHLGELGLVEGRNLELQVRHAGNRLEKFPELAGDLAKLKCDVFVTSLEASLDALVAASRDTPIVVAAVDFDPVATGNVASLARPGGRITGVTAVQSTLPAKRLELLKETLPAAHNVAVFTNVQTTGQLTVAEGTARRMGVHLHVVDFKIPPFDYAAGFRDALEAKADVLFVLGSGLWVPARRMILDLALKARLPSVFHHSGWVEAGGFQSYGFSFSAIWRRCAEMVAGLLRGAKINDLPMEQPTSFELAINLKTARSLGISVPRLMLLRADRVFE